MHRPPYPLHKTAQITYNTVSIRALELKFQSGIIPFILLCQCSHSIPVQLLNSRSYSDSIPHHSNSIPVNPEVYGIPYNVAQFLTIPSGKVHTEYTTCHFQFHTINSTIHHSFWPLQLCFLSCILDP